MAKNTTPEGAHPMVYRRALDFGRSLRRKIPRLKAGAILITALFLSLGVWAAIAFAATSLVRGLSGH
jgi:hypothetical protein